jgi:predicted nucleic acid-binding protein
MGKAIPVNVHYQWRPQLRDAADEMVLEAAVNGGANAIISFNHRDYGAAPQRFGVQLLTPRNFLRDFLRKVQS